MASSPPPAFGSLPFLGSTGEAVMDDIKEFSVWVPISDEIAMDAGWWPWKRPDYPPHFTVDLFPRLTVLERKMRLTRERVTDAWDVLLHGPPECDGDEW